MDNLLGHEDNAKNNETCFWVGVSLAVYVLSASLMNSDGLSGVSHTISVAYAQQEQTRSSEASTPFMQWYETQKDNLDSNQSANPISVKILSPAKDQRVPAGQDLAIAGTSTDNATSDCKVTVIVNGVRPYQQTVANGTGGAQDYSTWNFVITQAYTTIKEGPDNKITSKLECTPNLTKWSSVNVTGIDPTLADPNMAGAATLGGQGFISSLSISINIPSDSLTSGDDPTIEARVLDAVSQLQVNNAVIELRITDPLGNTAVISEEDGDILYTLGEEASEEGEENTLTVMPGTYSTQLRASAAGYDPESRTTTFDLIEQDDEDEDTEDIEIMEEDSESLGELFE